VYYSDRDVGVYGHRPATHRHGSVSRCRNEALQLRLRAPTGTRLERTELIEMKAMDVIKNLVGANNVEITTGFIGVQTPNYPHQHHYLFASGQHEAVVGVSLKPEAPPVTEALKEQLRHDLKKAYRTWRSPSRGRHHQPVMSFGSPTPIEVAAQGRRSGDPRLCREDQGRARED